MPDDWPDDWLVAALLYAGADAVLLDEEALENVPADLTPDVLAVLYAVLPEVLVRTDCPEAALRTVWLELLRTA